MLTVVQFVGLTFSGAFDPESLQPAMLSVPALLNVSFQTS